jgi:hypothetical protein
VLAEIAPDPAARRDYLARHFEGVAPGATHTALADLAAQGYIRVFVTTNFDRLLEHALQARGIEPVVVTSDADLGVARPREHARCYVLKPHGDYLQQTIRNTPEELAALEPEITVALNEVVDRYGVVALGYSGGDEALGRVLRATIPSRCSSTRCLESVAGATPSAWASSPTVYGRATRRSTIITRSGCPKARSRRAALSITSGASARDGWRPAARPKAPRGCT